MLKNLSPGKVFLDYGPVQMTISAFKEDVPLDKELEKAAKYVQKLLGDVSQFLAIAKLPIGKIKNEQMLPEVLQEMIRGVRKTKDPTLTPMATVAGAFSDFVADYLKSKGATKVIVNNGGDIALRLSEGESVKVGIVSSIQQNSYTHSLEIHSYDNIGGIATSGMGGRSFTKGIASAAIALSKNCILADASATLIGNHTFSKDAAIKQVAAEKIDPDTDIAGHLVTIDIDFKEIKEDTTRKALENGRKKARELQQESAINGAIIFIGKKMVVEPEKLALKIKEV